MSARERLAEERRALPWVKVDKEYLFDGPDGKVTLAGLFRGRRQLVAQHVSSAPDWNEACKSCSFWADGFERMVPLGGPRHHNCRDFARTAAKARMCSGSGWTFDWCRFRATIRSTMTTVFRSRRSRIASGDNYNFGTTPFGVRRRRTVRLRDATSFTPILLRARPRHDERRLSLPRPDPARRTRTACPIR